MQHTMTYLTLQQIKKHLNIDTSFTDDDDYLTDLGDVAEKIVETHLDNKLSTIYADSNNVLPSPILHACLLFIGNMYMNRESVSFSSVTNIPLSYEYLLAPYKNYNESKI